MNKTFSYTHCEFGVATRDVTPPVGIYARSWGAATHDVAEGVHRPFAATAAVFAPVDGDEPTLALVAVDLGWFQHIPDERALRATILERTGLDDEALLINMSHTHAGANINSELAGQAGRRADRALHRAPDRAARRGAPRGAREARAFVGDVRHGPLRAGRESRPLGCRRGALRVRLQPGCARRRHARRREGDRRERRAARDALQLRVPPDDARLA